MENNVVTLLFKENDAMIEYIKKKFYLPLMTSIQEVTGEGLDVEFVTPSIIEKREKELWPRRSGGARAERPEP